MLLKSREDQLCKKAQVLFFYTSTYVFTPPRKFSHPPRSSHTPTKFSNATLTKTLFQYPQIQLGLQARM